MTKDKLFTPVDGVIVEVSKKVNSLGLELPAGSTEKNEGVIISEDLKISKEMSDKIIGTFEEDEDGDIYPNLLGKRIKFTEGFDLGDNLFFIKLDKIIGIFK